MEDALRYFRYCPTPSYIATGGNKDKELLEEHKSYAKEGGYKFNEDAYLKFKYRLFSESDISPLWDRVDGSSGKYMKVYSDSVLIGMRRNLITTLRGRATRVPYLKNIEEKLAYIDWRLS